MTTTRFGATLVTIAAAAVLSASALAAPNQEGEGKDGETAPKVQETPAPLELRLGEGALALLIPRDERLEFSAVVELAGVEAHAGTVTLVSGVKPYRAGLLAPKQTAGALETASVEARAHGEYGVYTLDSQIETTHQPQAWPSLVHRFEQRGTERRRREILVGLREGQSAATYRGDTRNGAPAGARVWGPPYEFDVPSGVVDTISAPYVVRSMIRDGRSVATLNLLDKEKLWQVALTLGDPIPISTPAGIFEAREVHLATRLLERLGEPIEDDAGEEFAGPFGIKGHIRMWVEKNTGVPLSIKGRLPAGPFEIELSIRLTKFSGTPPGFGPLESKPAAPVDPAPSGDGTGDPGAGGGESGTAPATALPR